MEDLGADKKAGKINAMREAARCTFAQPPENLSGKPLHELIPGLEFLPGIEALSIFQVRSVQIEYGRESLLSAQRNVDDADHDLKNIYMGYEDPAMYISPIPYAIETQKQHILDVLAEDDVKLETRSQPYHISLYLSEDIEHDQEVYFFDPAARQDVGFAAMNHLLDPPEREPQIHHAVDDFDDEEESGVIEINVSFADAGLAAFAAYFDEYQPDGLNPALHEAVSEDEGEELETVSIPDVMQPMMYSSYYKPPRGRESIHREPPELRGPMRRPGWKPLDDTMIRIAEVMTPPAHFTRFSWSKYGTPDLTPDAEALFDNAVWHTDVSLELSLPASEDQGIELPHVVEASLESPNNTTNAGG
ncbi:hypothetical protein PMIN06_000019 [Paraphaeosphaeria minitans]